jgi:transposase
MTIPAELEAKILRYFHVEKWRVGTIAAQFHVHHATIKRVLLQAGVPIKKILTKSSQLDPYLPFVLDTLQKYPKLTAKRMYDMVYERGYRGGVDHFRHLMTLYRPKPIPEAYLRLRTLPGEQAQVDWGHFGHIEIGRAKRPLMAFVMVLSFSRKIFLRFYLNHRIENFLRGHEAAFNAWGGVPRVILADNLRSEVLERCGDAIRFNPTLLEFAAHYRYEPRPVAVARGNEKGRVERAIRYIRDNFFAARQWCDIDDLNEQATNWCNGPAASRPCPEQTTQSVQATFEQEQSMLMQPPDNPYATDERLEVKIGKTPYARFDLNDYSVPHTHAKSKLTVTANIDKVTILSGVEIIAEHKRSYDKAKQIEQEQHIRDLTATKKKARQHRGQNRLTQAVPIVAELLIKAAQHGYHMGGITTRLLQLLDDYGAVELEAAINDALAQEVPHTNAVYLSLERRREQRQQSPLVRLDLPDNKRVRELVIRPHDLNNYDQLQQEK